MEYEGFPLHTNVSFLALPIQATQAHSSMGTVVMSHQGEEGAEEGDSAEISDVGVHVVVLLLGEQRVVALDTAALHVLVPTRLNVCLHQGSFTLARCVELQLLHLVLRTEDAKGKVSLIQLQLFGIICNNITV